MSFLDDETLLNLLVEETFEPQKGPQEMTSYAVEYHSSIKCYQVRLDGKTYTFPSNWGPFTKVHKREGEGVVLENDLECFNSIFGSLLGRDIKASFIYKGRETYLVFVPKKMEISLKDLHSLINDYSNIKIAA
jgi:hypothetical protein